ncbi:MAG: phage terminase large subunit [Melioribacteraceae bacterium]
MKEIKLEIGYHKNQREIFFESNARYKVIAKGRRFGLTKGFAHYVIENMLDGKSPILWMDTTYGNIERYVERYFFPILKQLPKNLWKYRANRSDLKILNSVCDFRSADKPENIEGFGYSLIVLNEAGIILKNRRLWEESIRPMILDYKANVLIGGTPKGKMNKGKNEKHLFFELWERGERGDPSLTLRMEKSEWKSFNFSSYDNPLIDKNEIDEMAKEISQMLRDQEIYGKFVDGSSAGIIKKDWWKYYTKDELEKLRFIKRVQSWDTAFKKNEENDFSVCTTWEIRQNGFYLIDLWRGRVEFPELKKTVVKLFNDYKPNEVLIEDKASGQSLIQELQRETRIPIKPIKVNTDKIARVHAVTPLIECGRVFLPAPSVSPPKGESGWVGLLLNECEEFPYGEYDDIVDSISQFLNDAKIINEGNVDSIMHLERKRNRIEKRNFYKRMIGYTNRTLLR